MERRIGEIIKIKNPLGIMKVKIVKKLDLNEIGNNIGGLGEFKNLRVELYDSDAITLYDGKENGTKIYLFITGLEWEGYECEIIQTEKPEYDYKRIDCN